MPKPSIILCTIPVSSSELHLRSLGLYDVSCRFRGVSTTGTIWAHVCGMFMLCLHHIICLPDRHAFTLDAPVVIRFDSTFIMCMGPDFDMYVVCIADLHEGMVTRVALRVNDRHAAKPGTGQMRVLGGETQGVPAVRSPDLRVERHVAVHMALLDCLWCVVVMV